jgi:hypothetical protein
MAAPRHTSLEAQFRAAVPAQRAPLPQRVLWRLTLWLLALPFVQRLLGKQYRS